MSQLQGHPQIQVQNMSEHDLKTRCDAAADAARQGLDWLLNDENSKLVGVQAPRIARELRRDIVRAARLGRAVEQPLSIGVYGPSQAGKSYLVSVLARKPEGSQLIVSIGDGMDFIGEINPEGDKEATGLVTRFTMRQQSCPDGYPVILKLLTEADVVRILANTFFRDGDNTEAPPTAAEIETALAEARRSVDDRSVSGSAAEDVSGLSESDVWEVQAYFEGHFRSFAYTQNLGPFWEEAAQLLPHLSIAERQALLCILWGRYPVLSKLYADMAQALVTIHHSDTVFAGQECLKPRNTSIIDVATLAGLDGFECGGPVWLRTPSGVTCQLPRAIVAALTAELVLPMVERPWDLFEEADLLDFPGVRERKAAKGTLESFITGSEAPCKELFLRGKVGFLFERYIALQELSSMLLCVPPSNVNVAADLSEGVEEWIAQAQGASPEDRAAVDTMLFLVLTMFDRHLADPIGSLDPHQRFENRIEASLLAPFGGLRDSWPLNWTPGKAFNNTFWLRNPNYPAEHVIMYESGREISLLDHKIDRLEELKTGCTSSELVKRHIADPEVAWDAAMALNDGGVGNLVRHLTKVATKESKERQIAAQLNTLAGNIQRRLTPYFLDSDVEKHVLARRSVAQTVLRDLRRSFENRRFGKLLEEFSVHSASLIWRLERLPDNIRIVHEDVREGDGLDDWMSDIFDAPEEQLQPGDTYTRVSAAEPEIRTMSRERYQAETVLEAWREQMDGIAIQRTLETKLNLSPNSASEIASELSVTARRLNVADSLASQLSNWNARSSKPATIAAVSAERINHLVSRLGTDLGAIEDRPVMKNASTGESRVVFAEEPVRYDAMDLPESPARHDRDYFLNWTFAMHRMFEDNARSADGRMLNIEQNEILGSVLNALSRLVDTVEAAT